MLAHAERLALGVDLPVDHVELEPETALRGTRRCAAQRPPAHRGKGQFVDCMIWEEALNVLRGHDLCFVTDDDGFFDAEGNGDELHPCLAAEAQAAAHSLAVLRDLDVLLEDFREEFSVAADVLLQFVLTRSEAIRHAAEAMGIEAKGPPKVSYEAFATEKADEIEVRLSSVQPFKDATGRGRLTEGLRIEARALYGRATAVLDEVCMNREELLYEEGHGRLRAVPGSVAYARMQPLTIGSRQVVSDRRDLIDSA